MAGLESVSVLEREPTTTTLRNTQGGATVWKVTELGTGRRILVAYDGSVAGREALRTAVNMTEVQQQALTVLIATRRTPRYGETVAEVKEALTRSEQARMRLRNEVQALCGDQQITPRLLITPGRTVAELLRAARRERYDVIVLPARNGISGALLRVAERRAQRNAALVVRPGRSPTAQR